MIFKVIVCSFVYLAFSHVEAYEGYCYSDAKICEAIVDTGYIGVVDNTTVSDRPKGSVMTVLLALIAMRKDYCWNSTGGHENETCKDCMVELMKQSEATFENKLKGCITSYPNDQYPNLMKLSRNETVTLTLEALKTLCYYGPMGAAVFGPQNVNFTQGNLTQFTAAPPLYSNKWFLRSVWLSDYVNKNLKDGTNYKKTCKVAEDSEILKKFMSLKYYGLQEQQLKEEVMCNCLDNM